jgi:hypothetical protein
MNIINFFNRFRYNNINEENPEEFINLKYIYDRYKKSFSFDNSVKFTRDDKNYIIKKFKMNELVHLKNYIITNKNNPSFIITNLEEYHYLNNVYVLQEHYDENLYTFIKNKSFEERIEFLPNFLTQILRILVYLDSQNICYNKFNPYSIKIKDGNLYLVNFNNFTFNLKNLNILDQNKKLDYLNDEDIYSHYNNVSFYNGYNDIYSIALLTLFIITNKQPNNYIIDNNYISIDKENFTEEQYNLILPYLDFINYMINNNPKDFYDNYLLNNYRTIYPINFNINKRRININNEINIITNYIENNNNNININLRNEIIIIASIIYKNNRFIGINNLKKIVNIINILLTCNYEDSYIELYNIWNFVNTNNIMISNVIV